MLNKTLLNSYYLCSKQQFSTILSIKSKKTINQTKHDLCRHNLNLGCMHICNTLKQEALCSTHWNVLAENTDLDVLLHLHVFYSMSLMEISHGTKRDCIVKDVNSDFIINRRYVKNVHSLSQGQNSNWKEYIFFIFGKRKISVAL